MRVLTEEDIEDYEEDEPIWCPSCLNRGYQNRIGNRILMNNEPKPDNYEFLWECGVCGLKGDASQIAKEAEIQNAVELQESSEDNRTVIESIKKRKFTTGKPLIKRGGKKKKKELHHDPDIAREMKQFGQDNVHVIFDSNPQ
jgi:hypothetical protein